MEQKTWRRAAWGAGAVALGVGLLPSEESENGPWSRRDAAALELREEGITREQRGGYTPGVSELLHRAISPFGNGEDFLPLLAEIPRNLWYGRLRYRGKGEYSVLPEDERKHTVREDGFRLYLGMPQVHDSFSISHYHPQREKTEGYYFAVNGWFERYFAQTAEYEGYIIDLENPAYAFYNNPPLGQLVDALERSSEEKTEIKAIQDEFVSLSQKVSLEELPIDHPLSRRLFALQDQLTDLHASVMLFERYTDKGDLVVLDKNECGHVVVSLGRDGQGEYLAYYDIFDFGQPGQLSELGSSFSSKLSGKPFEIYDRFYFDRETWQQVPDVK